MDLQKRKCILVGPNIGGSQIITVTHMGLRTKNVRQNSCKDQRREGNMLTSLDKASHNRRTIGGGAVHASATNK